MRHPEDHHRHRSPWDEAPPWDAEIGYGVGLIIKTLERMENTMATQAQLDKFKADVAALIQASADEILAAVAAAQRVPPEQADAAIDALDTQVTAATQALTDAAAKLKLPPPAPPA